MSYKALYRRYRPKTFDEVVGQTHIIATLKNAIETNKLAHAYLFCGPRGTGKTSMAKLLAKAINCEDENNRPCCKCSNCIDIQEGTHPDVVELDAASNNGVEEARELVDKVKYAPICGKYKVYIIDEVHMMTSGAFNALLKTLEEPPEYCIFILATTDPQKVLPTIISRCQRFDFKKLPTQQIKERVAYICQEENIQCTDEAINLIAELADGGMRDALSILDQVAAYSKNQITAEAVSEVYGVVSLSEKVQLLHYVHDKAAKDLVSHIADISSRGLDIQRLTVDMITILKECVIYSYENDASVLSSATESVAQDILKMFGRKQILAFIDYLVDSQSKYRDASDSKIYFEVCLLKMMNDDTASVRENTAAEMRQPVRRSTANETTAAPIRPAQPLRPAANEEKAPRAAASTEVSRNETKPLENTNEKDLSLIPNLIKYEDEELYIILTKADKEKKAADYALLKKLATVPVEPNSEKALKLIQGSEIFASSSDDIILSTLERKDANYLNSKDIAPLVGRILSSVGINKRPYVITNEERTFYGNYFRSHQMVQPAPSAPVKTAEEKKDDVMDRLESLYGKGSFDIID